MVTLTMRSLPKLIAATMFLALAGCQTVPKGSFCDLLKLEDVRPSQAVIDAMSDAEKADKLALLRKGQRLCGWRP